MVKAYSKVEKKLPLFQTQNYIKTTFMQCFSLSQNSLSIEEFFL